ncbi:DUF397 domain-containing protein [Streptomyces sp. NBC_01423]|uniref:DUF397 domain-containing protein n=1 Tax=Streptomyces sp. NBC_01423 TaxID=2903860 RepID=UPI002E2B0580|nr:DUF397 domain-containing protein [Streptomyces sp. NBC_01423]
MRQATPLPQWRTSSSSNGTGGECVEAAFIGDCTAVRDSKQPEQGQLRVGAQTWSRFVSSVRAHRLG